MENNDEQFNTNEFIHNLSRKRRFRRTVRRIIKEKPDGQFLEEDNSVYLKFQEYDRAKCDSYKYQSNKDIKIKTVDSIYIKNFRSLKDRKIELGKHITLITGKNGTIGADSTPIFAR